jgi:hypothetical protein
VKEFATIREIDGYQVLFFTESDSDGNKLKIYARSNSGMNCSVICNYGNDEASMEMAFQSAKDGVLDNGKLLISLMNDIEDLDQQDAKDAVSPPQKDGVETFDYLEDV